MLMIYTFVFKFEVCFIYEINVISTLVFIKCCLYDKVFKSNLKF
jgi:hypothetical protein